MQKIIVLIMSLLVMSSFANIFDYSKKDLKTYISIGGEARFMDVEKINRNIFDLNSHSQREAVYDAEKTLVPDSLISYSNVGGEALHSRFGDNNELWVPTATVELGVLYKQLSVGFEFAYGFNQVSKAPNSVFTYRSEPHHHDTTSQLYTHDDLIAKHDASFRTMDFDLTIGYLLLPQESFINIAPRIKAGLQSIDITYPGNFGFAWTNDDEVTDAVRPYNLDNREYNSLGYTLAPEVEASLKISDYIQFSGNIGYRLSFFNQFKITQSEGVDYFWGDIDNSNHSYYAGAKFTVLIPSFNTKNRGKVNR